MVVPTVWWGSERHDPAQRAHQRLTLATFSKKGEHGTHPNEDRYAAFGDLNAELLSRHRAAVKQAEQRAGGADSTAGSDGGGATAAAEYNGMTGAPPEATPPANAFFGVYDGHGGHSSSQHLSQRLHLLLASDMPTWREDPKTALVHAFALAETELRQVYEANPGDRSGACAAVGLLRGNRLLVAWVGDCRAVLIRSEASAESCVALSRDHRATDSQERSRILKAGGEISDGRVWGALMPSRTLGDFPWKDKGPGLSAVPEIAEVEITAEDKYLVIGSDGIFDVLPNKALGRIASKMNSSAQKVCNEIQKELKKKPTSDDTTMIVIQLHAGSSSP